jgi:hypothetical protein
MKTVLWIGAGVVVGNLLILMGLWPIGLVFVLAAIRDIIVLGIKQ